MIQLNLLPDVKMEYIRAQRARRLVFIVSIMVTIVSVGLLLLLLSVSGLQKKHLNDLSNDISAEGKKLQQQPGINRILTVQNQLGSLTALHSGKPATARLFGYLNDLTPAKVNITNFKIDFVQNTISITGTADMLSNVNKYVDTLKFTTYTTDGNSTKQSAFNNIVLSSFSPNTNSQDANQAANYTITLSYDPTIFDTTKDVKLLVPALITTRSQLDQPTDLFKAAPVTKGAH